MRFLKIGVIIAIVLVSILYLQEQGDIQKNALQLKIAALTEENSELEHEIGALEQKVSKLRSDTKTVEKVAKRKLGMVRQDETIYIFDPVAEKK
ncbi:MAG: septum formation initiator family protein [Deltaproteobacteria bacterium]|nr:septum formation initiator family protein [Deltaproteobacteria bacterium]